MAGTRPITLAILCVALATASAGCEQHCKVDGDCPTAFFCASSVCTLAAGANCTTSGKCTCPGPNGFVSNGACDTAVCAPSNDAATIEATCVCGTASDCNSGNTLGWACGPGSVCVPQCSAASDCAAGDVCEDSFCRPPAAGENSECPAGQEAIGGQCAPPIAASTVATCLVLPETAVINAGGRQAFSVLTSNAQGGVVPYEGTVTWTSSDTTQTITAQPGGAVVTAATGAAAATLQISATIGSVSCTPAALVQYAAAGAGQLRVVVVSADSPQPISGATVVIDDLAPLTTGLDGTVSLTNPDPASPHTVSVFAVAWQYVTFVGTLATDVLVPLKAAPAPGTFNGSRAISDFAGLSDVLGTVHLGIHGSSIAGNVMDVSLADVVGAPVAVQANLGTAAQLDLTLPTSTAFGLGQQMFKGGFGVQADPGHRVLWSLEGNLTVGQVLSAVPENGQTSQLWAGLLEALLPSFGTLESSAVLGVNVAPSVVQTLPAAENAKPDTLLRLHQSVQMPTLPSFLEDDGVTMGRFDGAAVIGGVLASPQGFVPLGVTDGKDLVNAAGNTSPDGLIDPATTGAPEGMLPLRMAPRHDGLETSPWEVLALAASPFAGLFQAATATPATSDQAAMFSGVFSFPPVLPYDGGAETTVNLGASFLNVPSLVAIDEPTRSLTILQDVSGIAYHRLDVGTGAEQWSIYFPPGDSSVSIPAVPAGVADRFVGGGPGARPLTALFSVTLGLAPSETYDDVVQFDGADANDLNRQIDRFSSRQLIRNE